MYNAFQSLQALEAGQGQRKAREQETAMKGIGNAFASGDYTGAANQAFGMGDLSTGMDISKYGKGLEDAAAEEKRVGLIKYGMSLLPVPVEQREAMRPQIAEALRQSGIELDPAQLQTMDLSDNGIKGFLSTLQDTASLMAQYQGMMAPAEEYTLAPGAERYRGSEVVASNVKPEGPMSTMGKLAADLQAGRITQEQYDGEVARMQRSGVNVNVSTGANGQEIGTIPQGYAAVKDDSNPSGYRLEVIPGSEADTERRAAIAKTEKGNAGGEKTLRSLVGAYTTLRNNKAITSSGNSTAENAAAIYSRTPLGKFQDELGGEVGNLDNAEARQTIEGLSMAALMRMISASEVSAKAMDSDAEMRNWLTAIKSDNYEAALTKLHVLDVSFGRGDMLQNAFADGEIDLQTYQRITRRLNSDPMTKQMYDKAMRYRGLGEAIGPDNMTASELAELERLEALERGGQ